LKLIEQPRPTDDVIPAALGDPDWQVRQGAVRTLAERPLSGDELDALLTILGETHHDFARLNAAIQVLVRTGADVVAALVELLGSPDPDVRCYVALALGERGDLRAADALVAALEDPQENVVLHAIEALGRLRTAAAVDRLIEFVDSRRFAYAFSALTALAAIGDERIAGRLPPLLGDPLLQAPAVEALGALGDRDSVEPLAECLKAHSDVVGAVAAAWVAIYDREQARFGAGPEVAERIRRGLGAAGMQALVEACDGGPQHERRALVRLIGILQVPNSAESLVRCLQVPSLREEAHGALAGRGASATAAMIGALPSADVETQLALSDLLGGTHDPAAVGPLVDLLEEEETEVVVAAVGALGRLRDPRCLAPVSLLFGHENKGVRHAAVLAARKLSSPENIARTARLLQDESPVVREAAVKILGGYDARAFAAELSACSRDSDERVRRAAVEHLPVAFDEPARQRVLRVAESDRPTVRAAALVALAAGLREPVAREAGHAPLLRGLDDADAWVRYVALRELLRHDPVQVADERLARFVDQADDVPARILALSELGRRRTNLPKLVAFADDADPDVTAAALEAIGTGRFDDGPAFLAKRLADPDPRRRLAAVRAWAAIGGAEAARQLGKAALDHDPVVARGALGALARTASADSTAELLEVAAVPALKEAAIDELAASDPDIVVHVAQGLHHPLLDIRRAAVEVLTRLATPRAIEALLTVADDSQPSLRHAARYAVARLCKPPRGGSEASAPEEGH
jgi:HEAT repeat protein